MTIPANLNLEAAPYGAQPVVIVSGPQGGPYSVVTAGAGLPLTGDVAAGAADTGAPVKVGGVGSAAIPAAVATGQRANVWLTLNGAVMVGLTGSADVDGTAGRRGIDTAGNLAIGPSGNYLLNAAGTWDRQRANQEVTLLASAARTATVQSADQVNYNGTRLLLTVDVSLVGTGSITPVLQVKDPVSGNYATVWTAAAAIVANGTFTYLFQGGASGGSFTEKLAFGLPSRTWRIQITHNNVNTITYSVGANVGV